MITILPCKIKKFSYLVHLADIHLRLTKRHDEYREVFSRLFDSISKTPEDTVVSIVGDVVHSKLDLSPECVQLTQEFLSGLANIRPTILVAGNHDTNLTNKNRLDSLSPIVEAMDHPNLYYLKKSGLYSLGDICLNNYSVFDDEEIYLNGKDIPAVYRNQYRYFVCLFHGTIDGSVSEMGFKLVNKSITLPLFDHHDIVLLGDIHKKQDLQKYNFDTDKPAVRYCGSLIQQNHGEDLDGHGYTIWNLPQREYDHIPIYNDYGYFTVKVDKGEITTDLSNIPKKARVRLSCYESLPTETKAAIKEIKKVTELVEPPTYTREEVKDGDKRTATLTTNLLQGDLKNKEHQIKLITDYLKTKVKVEDEELIKEVININDRTNDEVRLDNIAKNIRWNPIRFEWDNLFSFGESNSINFTNMKEVVGLFATNAAGKSSVFSALSWCIFDKCERDFKANNIINDQKMSCRAQLEVDIGGVHYFIERVGKMDKKGNVKVNVKFWRVINGTEENLCGIERADTNSSIRKYMGSYEDFLLTSLSVQRSGKYETSFIDLGDSGRKDLLAQFLGLNIFDILHEEANSKLNEIVSTLRVYKNEDFEGDLKTSSDSLSQTELLLESENKKLVELNQTIENLTTKIVEESSKIQQIKGCNFDSREKAELAIKGYKSIIEEGEKQNLLFTEKMQKIQTQISDVESQMKVYEKKDVDSVYTEWKRLSTSKVNINSTLSQKIAEARILKEKSQKTDGYEYDSTCKFCVKNANDLVKDATNAKKQLDGLKIEVEKLMAEQKEINNKLNGISSAETEYNSYHSLFKDRNELQKTYFDLNTKRDKVNKEITSIGEKLKISDAELKIWDDNKEAVLNNNKINGIVVELNKDLWNRRQEQKQLNRLVQDLIGKKSVLSSKIQELKAKIEKVKQTEKIHKAYDLYVQSVCRDGIPYEVICSAVPAIENEVNSILSQIVEFHAKFDVDGKNIIPYIVYDERHWLMSLGSGMEQFILSTAIRVALTNLSNLPRANFLIIDEGFGVLAAENLSTMQTLFHFLKTNFDFVIIVSHLDALRDMVDSHIEIKKENGFSKVNFE